MIVGLFLRNFKTYEKFNFISFSEGKNEKLNLFIGNNGAGKSSVLEALDVFFNAREFILNDNARSRDASVTPVILIKKEKLNPFLKPEILEFTETLSTFIWNESLTSLYGSNPSMELFSEMRENLKTNIRSDDYYLLLFGHELSKKDYSLISLETKAESKFAEIGIDSEKLKRLLNSLVQITINQYNYIYIPVETSITDFLKLEASGMQSLMNKDLKNEIEQILSDHKFEIEGKTARKRNVSISQFINERLKEYIETIETTIQNIDNTYHFNKELRSTNVNPKDFSDVIINTFFSKRRLQKEEREIAYLSSGERKKALIDIAFSFIAQNTLTEKEVILAIDEPEASLHISMCFEQYMRIEKIANTFNIQSFITTHWYGGLPILSYGRLYHVLKNGNNPDVEIFDLENYFEVRKSHPDDINLKSFYDLTSSIVSSVRNNGDKWLIVEGLADKKYIEHYLPEGHPYRILPVGGCGIVKKIYEYLYLPLSQDEEVLQNGGKIFCLVDTDAKAVSIEIPAKTKNNTLMIRRLQIEFDEIKLLTVDQGYMGTNTETELEEALNPHKFFLAFNTVVKKYGDFVIEGMSESVQEIFSNYEFDDAAKFSFIKGEHTFLKSNIGGRSNSSDLKTLHIFFDLMKNETCNEYIKLDNETRPNWIQEIINFLG